MGGFWVRLLTWTKADKSACYAHQALEQYNYCLNEPEPVPITAISPDLAGYYN